MKRINCSHLVFTIFLIWIFLSTKGFSQTISVNESTDPESNFSPEELIRNVLIDGNCAEVSNISSTVNGLPNETTSKSYGYFKRAPGSSFPFEEGIILTTGIAFNVSNPNTPQLSDPSTGLGDSDLSDIDPATVFTDATVFEFDFVPTSDEISFRYLMASEEYTGNFPCEYSDIFAFLLRPVTSTEFENIALVPNTNIPVSVTNVHPGMDENGNSICGGVAQNPDFFGGYQIGDTNFNGRTVVLAATATVIPNTTYRIKLVIADANSGQPGAPSDSLFDSAVFLEAGSFNLGLDLGDDFITAGNSAVCGDEIPLTANIVANEYTWYKDGVLIPGATEQTYIANLGDGLYTCEIANSVSCTDSDDILLEFVEAATINPNISNLQECDADGDLTEVFNLTLKDSEILDGQDPATFEVEYFTDSAYQSQITDPSNYINTSPSQTIYTRVVNSTSTNCTAEGSFVIEATGLPTPTQPEDYVICDDDTDGSDTNGFVQNFILSSRDSEILGGLDPSQFRVSYHLTAADAQIGVNPIDKINTYTNTTANQQAIYYRVENIDNVACFQSADDDASTPFDPLNLVVSPLPSINASVELRQCDDDTDGFSVFNLNEANELISPSNFMNETFEFYETQADAQNGINVISNSTAYTNQIQTNDQVWARAISSFDCFRIAQIDLIVATNSSVVTNFTPRTYNECDDFLDEAGNDTADNDDTDGITTFDFSDVTDDLINDFPVSERPNLIVSYYRNELDAFSELNPIDDPANYRNIGYPNAQQIYVRVDNTTNNDCEGIRPLIDLNVDPVPTANLANDLELCDNLDDGDGFNGIVQTFDLDSQTDVILGTQNSADFTVTYHTSAAEALSGNNPIADTDSYENITPNQQTIYVRVTNNTTGCFTNHTSFDLIVNQLPVANFVEDLEICDDDSDGSARNGFSQSFDLESQTATILGSQDPNQFNVTYHASLADAQAGDNPLGSPFSNSVPFTQTIYVRVTNGDSGCANGISNFNVIVNPEPIAADVSNLSYCDDDIDGDDTNGFVQNIDLDDQIPGILDFDMTGQDEDDYTVTFHESQADATSGVNALSSPYSNTIANQQTIYVRVVNNDTGCVNDDRTFDIIVNPLPDFEVTTPQIVCLNGPALTIGVENPGAVYDYVWTDSSGNTIINSQITVTSGGLYSVTATTTNGTNCARTREIQVNESIIATLTENDITIVDDSANNSISIDTTNLGIGDYEFALTDENGNFLRNYQDDPIFEDLEGGFYTILVNDKNGCGTASLEVSVVEFPKFFTPNNDGVNDTWAIKGANSIFYPNSQINIFNRFGKVMAQIDIDNPGWDGTFNGNVLPSDDYWFSIKLIDRNGNVRERAGNLTLIRRN